ncbi:Bug family tripartite tricarboxylate transporter substrate binding protein [Bordetella bronchiseptica]|uniref:Exported protein n=1 Tax=Bordetella bronchiseptica (strain ATCC BAA-588 / NCTC 13252 / RB50) TaxID=257310 RepID=A0A0H3LHX3_BORBR|nr:tripartite tricarboxylate transporter substrate-binding protein [Bordetella bronchiseptica]KAK68245.1 tripartite tricarboxylate transporter family receptor [Bordetella bronchiseptica 980-2]AMG87260.1 hypothetical protein AL472_05130 [Bordetella bronchiseptica]AWP78430.1 hypothetical protein B7P04_03710 [Bordetella bronchiseptica]AWP83245.1 hypothetical protein B7P00_03685 [Bordetella bronchiseptica]AWQ08813.1 hypothetical protein B9G72_03680 [Bordetella bronchiseptica]
MQAIFKGLIIAATALSAGAATAAPAYPSKPVTLIVPFAPGASADGVARLLGRKLADGLGQPVVVENRPGAGGTTGLMALAHAAPDGYTLAIGATGAIAVNHHLPDAAPLDAAKQLAPVAKVADIPLVFIASRQSQLRSMQDIAAQAARTKGGLSYGTSGQFTSQHLAGELYADMAKTALVAVPYRGSSPALTDVIAGQVPLAVVDLTSAFPQIKAGKVTGLAVTGTRRAIAAPDIPTVAELGFPGYAASGWLGMFAPAGTPAPVVAQVSAQLETILADPQVGAELLTLAVEPAYLDPAEFAAYARAESDKWGKVIGAMGQAKSQP